MERRNDSSLKNVPLTVPNLPLQYKSNGVVVTVVVVVVVVVVLVVDVVEVVEVVV